MMIKNHEEIVTNLLEAGLEREDFQVDACKDLSRQSRNSKCQG
jgi:hypothetical protein